jgi:hypothetical protein
MLRYVLPLAAALALFGCEELLNADDASVRDAEVAPEDVAGRWTITGDGVLRGCDDERLNTESLRIQAVPFEVAQIDDTLEGRNLPQPPGGSFTFEQAAVNGERVSFTTIEESREASIALAFSGRVDSLGRIAGRFEGIGPGECESVGSFLVTIE